jgi:TetR/AcrR family transcriptional regulator
MNGSTTQGLTETQQHIISAATRLFAAHGFDGTPVQAIADEVGMSKQAVLHHYPSKEHVRRAVLDSIVTHWNEKLPELLVAASASEDRFDAVFGELVRFFLLAPDRARLVLREALDRPQEVDAMLRGPVRPWLLAVARYILAGQQSQRHFPEADAEAYVLHVMQLVLVAVAARELAPSFLGPHALERYDLELVRIAKAAIFAPRPRSDRKLERTKR